MTNAYTCNRLVQEASALDMDLQIVGIHDTCGLSAWCYKSW